MDPLQQRAAIVEFLNSVAKPGNRIDDIDDNTNLIQAGVIDSFAVIQIISFLEQHYDLNLQAASVDPATLGSISGILTAIAGKGG